MNCGLPAYSRSVKPIHSRSSPWPRTTRTAAAVSTSPALARVNVRPFRLLARRREALLVPGCSFVAPVAVGVAAAGPCVVEADEAGIRVAVAVRHPGHELAVQLVAREAQHLVHLLEQDVLPERERELVVDVVAAEAGRPLEAPAETDPLRQMSQQFAHARVARGADEHGVRTPVDGHLAEIVRLHSASSGRTTYTFLIFVDAPANGPVPWSCRTSPSWPAVGSSSSDAAKSRLAAANCSISPERSCCAAASLSSSASDACSRSCTCTTGRDSRSFASCSCRQKLSIRRASRSSR